MSTQPIVVTFTGNNAGLNAAAVGAAAQLKIVNTAAEQLAQRMVITGQITNVTLNKALASLRAEAAQISGVLRAAGAEIGAAGAHAANAGHGFSGMARELIVLGHEASQGRYTRLGGSLMVMAEYAMPMVTAFAAANPVIAATAAVALVAATAIGYLTYQAVAAKNAMQAIELGALVAGFQQTDEQASNLRDTIEQLAGVSASDAEEIAAAFQPLGPQGAEIIKQLASALPDLAKNMGDTMPEAAKKLAKSYENVNEEGRELVIRAGGAQAGIKFDQATTSAQRYQLVVDATTKGLHEFANQQHMATAAMVDSIPPFEEGASAWSTLSESATMGGAAVKAASDKIAAAAAIAAKSRQNLAGMPDFQPDVSVRADKAASELDPLMHKIQVLRNQIVDMQQQMTKVAISPSTDAGADVEAAEHLIAGINKAKDEVKGLQEQLSDGLMKRTGSEQDRDRVQQLVNTWAGAQTTMLEKEREMEEASYEDMSRTESERAASAKRVTELTKQINESGLRDEQAQDQLRVIAAKGNADQILRIRQEAARRARQPVAGLGPGSEADRSAQVEVAHAQEAVNEAILAETERTQQAIIKKAQETAAAQKSSFDALLKEHQISEQTWLQDVTQTATQEKAIVAAAFDAEIAAAKDDAAKREALETQKMEAIAAIDKGLQNDQQQAGEQQVAQAKQVADKIAGIMNSQVDGLLRGTESIRTAFKNMAVSAIEDLIKMGVQMALEKAALALNMGSGGGLGLFSLLGGGGFQLPSHAAGTPFVKSTGPALLHEGEAVIPRAANPFAGGRFALPGFDAGAWDLPSDMLSVVHRGEMIPTASQSAGLRNLIESGGAQGGDTHNHTHNWGGVNVTAHGGELDPDGVVRALHQAVQSGGHLQYPAFRGR